MLLTPRRGDVVWIRLDHGEGSEQTGERPAVVLSPDVVNERSPVVLVAAMTSKKTERVFPSEALIRVPEGGLSVTSKVLLLQMRGVDKSRLLRIVGSLSSETMRRIEDAIRVATGLRR